MKTIIAGSRSITDERVLFKALKKYPIDITEVVCGMSQGADRLGFNFGACLGIPIKEFPAEWKLLGKKAGIVRNLDMANYADCLLALWDGKSRGTKHMIKSMKDLNKPVYIYYEDPPS